MISKKAAVKAAAKGKIGNLVRYLLDQKGKGDRVAAVTVTNCECGDPEWAVHEMQAVQSRNQRAKADRTYHLVISFRAGEDLPEDALAEIEREFCAALGFAEHQRVSVVHRDTDHLHVHVAINKVHPVRFTLHEPFNDYHTRAKLCERLEARYGLATDNGRSERNAPVHQKAAAMEAVAGVESLIGYVRRTLKEAVAAARDWTDLHRALAAAGVTLKPQGNGLVVESNGTRAKASSCLRELSKAALEKRLGPYRDVRVAVGTPGRKYQARPMQPESERLYLRYQTARTTAKQAQHDRLGGALAAHRSRVQQARTAYNLQRTIIDLTRRNAVNTVMRQFHRANLKSKIAASFATYQTQRRAIYREAKLLAWNDWLMVQASAGDQSAQRLLQSRHAKQVSGVPSPTPFRNHLPKSNARPNYAGPGVTKAGHGIRPPYSGANVQRAPHPSRPDYGRGLSFGAKLLWRAAALLQSRLGKSGGSGPARPLASVRDLSGVDVVYDRPGTEVLLRTHEPDRLGSQSRSLSDPTMRRSGTGVAGVGSQTGKSGSQSGSKSRAVTAADADPPSAYATRNGTLRGVARTASRLIERAKGWTR